MSQTHHWDAIVIGSGLGGLTAAAVFARAGKRVLVLERQANFGGCATVYRHDGLTMEASLHEIDGHELTSEHGVLRQLGLADAIEPIRADVFYEARSKLFGAPVRCPHGLEAARAALAQAFPDAADGLNRYFGLLSRLDETLTTFEEAGVRGPGAVLPLIFSGRLFEVLGEAQRTLAQEFDRFFGAHEAVKLALAPHLLYFDDDPAKMSFLLFGMVTAHYIADGSYYVRGGSRRFTDALVHLVKEAGGDARRKRTASAILLDADGRVAGVRHTGPDGVGEEDFAPVVFGNAAPELLKDMLPERERADFGQRYEAYEPSISLFTVQLGLSRPAASFGVSAYSTFLYPDWMERLDQMPIAGDVFGGPAGASLPPVALCDYGRLAPGLGPSDEPSLVSLTGVDRLWAWDGFDDVEDKARRAAWIEAFVADLDRRYPGIAAAVVHAEMSTARTLRNRLGTPHGEAYGFRPTPQRLFSRPPSPRTAVEGLWLSSAYTISGGYAGAMHGGMIAGQAALAAARRRR